jgi:ParB/RepB/Spo0J family partition protein
MTTTTAVAFRSIPLDLLSAHPANRAISSDEKLASLAESLRCLGQTTPIIVRPLGDSFQILAGHRRHRAGRIAGLETLEAKIIEADDQTALCVVAVENLQREDLTHLEQAEQIAQLLAAGQDPLEIAAQLGRTVAWVTARAHLRHLHMVWREGLTAGKFEWASIGYLERIARLPEAIQIELAADLDNGLYDPESLEKFDEDLAERYLHQLAKAPWKLDDLAVDPAAGPCSTCTKRSGCQQTLFADMAAADRCLDAACWRSKLATHTRSTAHALAEKHRTVAVVIEPRHGATTPPTDLPPQAAVVSSRQIERCAKREAGAIAAVDAETGERCWIKPTSWADKATRQALGQEVEPEQAAPTKPDPTTTPAERREAKRVAQRVGWRLEAIDHALHTKPDDPPPLEDIVAVFVAFGLEDFDPLTANGWKEVHAMDLPGMTRRLWQHVLKKGLLLGTYNQKTDTGTPDGMHDLETFAGLTPAEQEAKALVEIPEPKRKG